MDTHHELKYLHRRALVQVVQTGPGEEFEDVVYEENYEYLLWVCCGCDTGTLGEAYNNTEMQNLKGLYWESTYYPKRKRHDLPCKHFYKLGPNLAKIYREVIACFNADAKILCAVGLRALLEGVCADKGIKDGTLEKKIGGLDTFLPKNIVDSLHGFRFMGNEAAHELQAPTEDDLRLAIEVMEDLLDFLYSLDYKASRLRRSERPSHPD